MSCDQVVQIISKMCTIATCVVFVNLVFILEEVAWIKYIFDLKFYNISDYQLNYEYQALIHWENTCPSYFTYITLKHFLDFFTHSFFL
jgi:hypothetical protein